VSGRPPHRLDGGRAARRSASPALSPLTGGRRREGDYSGRRFVLLLCLLLVLCGAGLWLFERAGAAASARSPAALVRAFHCIHRYEGAWNDPHGPYWGGLQMDYGFQSTYGREYLRAFGTADHWPPSLQIAVAIRAYLSGRGFSPWPYTARRCGLL